MSVKPLATAMCDPAELYEIAGGFMNEASTREFEQSRPRAVTLISISNVFIGSIVIG